MSYDLFFVPASMTLAKARAKSFKITPALAQTRADLLAALTRDYPGARLVAGSNGSGHVEGFPHGMLDVYPGYLFWSVHGAEDAGFFQPIVDWFYAHGHVCDDPQGGEYDNRDKANAESKPQRLKEWSTLHGALLKALNYEFAPSVFQWRLLLADGRRCDIEFHGVLSLRLPEHLHTLREARVTAVETTQTDMFDPYRVLFDNGAEITFSSAGANGKIQPA